MADGTVWDGAHITACIIDEMKKRIITIGVLMMVSAVGAFVVFAAEQIKTNEVLVYSSSTSINSNINTSFTLYIGDNLSGVTNPVKSLYFVASGVYTGSGTVDFKIDSDEATLQSFTLPSVINPTPFVLIYKDSSNKINPTSAGSYNYTLDVTPFGVVMYGLGIKMSETYQYAPTVCDDGIVANEKIKTNEVLVYSSNTSINSNINTSFTLYIGDNLSGVTNPVKSLYFVASGVYTGSGTVDFKIDSDEATLQSFTLPSVINPTPFVLIYKDSSNKINPTSAGSYNYTLDVTPFGVVMYGLGIKMSETHQYKPPSCSIGLPTTGELISAVFDSAVANGVAYNSIMWKGTEGTGKVRFQFAASNSTAGPWNYYGGETCGAFDWFNTTGPDSAVELKGTSETTCQNEWNNKRYFRYKIQICSNTDCATSGDTSPVVEDVVVNWAP